MEQENMNNYQFVPLEEISSSLCSHVALIAFCIVLYSDENFVLKHTKVRRLWHAEISFFLLQSSFKIQRVVK